MKKRDIPRGFYSNQEFKLWVFLDFLNQCFTCDCHAGLMIRDPSTMGNGLAAATNSLQRCEASSDQGQTIKTTGGKRTKESGIDVAIGDQQPRQLITKTMLYHSKAMSPLD
jgi:hypothetical protein